MVTVDEMNRLVALALDYKHNSNGEQSADDYAFVAANIIVKPKMCTIPSGVIPFAEIFAISRFLELYKEFSTLIFPDIEKELNRKKNLNKATQDPLSEPYRKLEENIKALSCDKEAKKLFLLNFATDMAAAEKAKAFYLHAFSTARVAYVGARIATYCASDSDEQFKVEMKKRLLANLYVPMEPGFFMRVMCHRATKIVGLLLLLAGLTALSFGIAGVVVASFGALIASVITLNATSLSLIGGGITAVSGGLLTGHFFAKKHVRDDNQMRASLVDNLNRVPA